MINVLLLFKRSYIIFIYCVYNITGRIAYVQQLFLFHIYWRSARYMRCLSRANLKKARVSFR